MYLCGEECNFGWAFTGFGQLVVLLVLAALAGILAAIGPARRAARLDVLEALAHDPIFSRIAPS
jgi:hypothetical protein